MRLSMSIWVLGFLKSAGSEDSIPVILREDDVRGQYENRQERSRNSQGDPEGNLPHRPAVGLCRVAD